MQPENILLLNPDAKLGMAIRVARLRQGWSLAQLAQRLYCDARTIHRIEIGETKTVAMSTVQELARVLRSPRILRLGIEHIQQVVPDLSPTEGQVSA